ncbi:SAM-dependent methyltransferase [Amycolatopsis decaplanina]|uniref:Erythromycin C methyltransferase n=1 Tax=Amycolatopsis decaplanina DSM 44594 TaxID=1284240 RepID=M2X949_9PSEU|nr:class I SAM-dependent methyltransferase [Amycolatopsis decaplanina]EME57631.1 erythromycin C methyltransferase [Amycolatopsis decaplanina DSM 44594]
MSDSARPTPQDQILSSYDFFDPETLLTAHSSYMNLGYWAGECATADDASVALAHLLADSAGFRPGDRVLDAGFGFGDQDFYWLENWRLKSITALNIGAKQVKIARRRAGERKVSDRIDFRQASATGESPRPGGFDRVVALESAFHFDTREDFFARALESLRPGGTIATADILKRDSFDFESISPEDEVKIRTSLFSGVPPVRNWYGARVYAEKLAEAGFVDVSVRSIREEVFEPFLEYSLAMLEDAEFQQRVGAENLEMSRGMLADAPQIRRCVEGLDYVVAVATKPA